MSRHEHVWYVADHLITPLAVGTGANFGKVALGVHSVQRHDELFGLQGLFYASVFEDREDHIDLDGLTRFERLLVHSGQHVLAQTGIAAHDPGLRMIIASAKGNIHLAGHGETTTDLVNRISLHRSAQLIAQALGTNKRPLVLSNACISGLLAFVEGSMLLRSGACRHVLIMAGDILSDFILAGFRSLMALGSGVCRPFDKDRDGINLGEAAGAVLLSVDSTLAGPTPILVHPGAATNDANHISGPSRTGQELALAMRRAMQSAMVGPQDIDFISGHGTATLYNDEMESKAIGLAGLQQVPVNSLKAYYGHTLGAAGLIETILSVHSLREGLVLPTLGFETPGVSVPVNICHEPLRGSFRHFLKSASGFGGCNAAAVFSKT
jgi:3-oxoacyl-[acyl-carrier-protein] synthase I